jgi:hypothetical protein
VSSDRISVVIEPVGHKWAGRCICSEATLWTETDFPNYLDTLQFNAGVVSFDCTSEREVISIYARVGPAGCTFVEHLLVPGDEHGYHRLIIDEPFDSVDRFTQKWITPQLLVSPSQKAVGFVLDRERGRQVYRTRHFGLSCEIAESGSRRFLTAVFVDQIDGMDHLKFE